MTRFRSLKTAQTIEQSYSENSPEIKQTSRRKSKRGDASRIKPWQWKPGQSGNPGGRPKGIVSAALLEQLLRKAPKGGKSELQAIVEAIVATAKKGNAKAFCAIRDTVDGPPKPDPQDRGPQGSFVTHRLRQFK